jgi:[ribosomal protein S18]-alanine N-acetyltransferase
VVARAPVRAAVREMTLADIPAVHRIEKASFPTPWPVYAFRQELESNRLARYLVASVDEELVAYAGVWLLVDEAHVTTFAVMPDWRERGIGARLLMAVLRLAEDIGASVATLEVRLSNVPARRLYEKFGFRPVGIRPRYYSDNGEDALIMTTEALEAESMRARLERLQRELGRSSPPIDPPRRRER